MDRNQAYEIVREHVSNENLIRHMLAVEASKSPLFHILFK